MYLKKLQMCNRNITHGINIVFYRVIHGSARESVCRKTYRVTGMRARRALLSLKNPPRNHTSRHLIPVMHVRRRRIIIFDTR